MVKRQKKASVLLQMQRLKYAAHTFQQLENLVEIHEQAGYVQG